MRIFSNISSSSSSSSCLHSAEIEEHHEHPKNQNLFPSYPSDLCAHNALQSLDSKYWRLHQYVYLPSSLSLSIFPSRVTAFLLFLLLICPSSSFPPSPSPLFYTSHPHLNPSKLRTSKFRISNSSSLSLSPSRIIKFPLPPWQSRLDRTRRSRGQIHGHSGSGAWIAGLGVSHVFFCLLVELSHFFLFLRSFSPPTVPLIQTCFESRILANKF